MAFKDALIAASPALLGMGQQLSGRNPAGISSGIAMMNAEQEKAKRKAAIEGLIGSMGLSQQKRDFLSTLPFEQQAPMIWDMMNPQAVEGKVMGDRLVDPYTGKVISDFSPKPLDLSGIFGSEQGQEIKAGLMARGLPEHVADAFLVNMNDESGLNPGINERNPVVPGSRGGFGLAQWTGPRRKQLEAYAAQRGTSPDDMNTQLDFLVTELQGSESQAGQKILNAPDRATAAQAIVNDFLRPAEQHRDARSARYATLDKQITDITRILSSGQGTPAQRESLEFRRKRLMDEQSTLAPQAPKITDDMAEYEKAKEDPGFADYMKEMRKAGATNIENIVGQPGSPGWEAVDKAFADTYMQWMQGGGSDTIKQISQLEGVLDQLSSGEPITGPAIGLQPQALQAIFSPEALDARQRVEEVVQRNLKAILGAQFTQQEGDRLISRAFDQRLSPEQNARRLKTLVEQMKYAAAAKQGMISHFSQAGTLRGFDGGGYIPTVEDFHAALDALDRQMGVRSDALDGFTQEELDWLEGN